MLTIVSEKFSPPGGVVFFLFGSSSWQHQSYQHTHADAGEDERPCGGSTAQLGYRDRIADGTEHHAGLANYRHVLTVVAMDLPFLE